MKLEIKNRCTGAVIFSHDCEDNSIKITLVVAIASRVNLIGANLSGADLIDANLSGANLSYADLIGANLSGADLSGADLIGANLSYADLRGANLSGANLSYADLRGANLIGANLSYADLIDANLIDANLSGADLIGANLSGATGNNSRMSCLQLGAYRIVVLDCEICWGGCTKKTVREWLKYKGEYLSASEQHYLKTVTKPFLRMCLKMECDV